MPSKLGHFCENVIEAAWLAVVILTPVFFNIYSSRIFEPDKISLLRSLALVILAAWLVHLAAERQKGMVLKSFLQVGWMKILKTPLMLSVLFMSAVMLLATLFSVSPRISFLGSYQRLQGTYTFLSYLVFFSALCAFLRRRQQVDRLVNAIILSSLPVALYGVLQRLQVDPIPWGGNTTIRVASNLGNSIFVAAYLSMTFILLLERLVQSGRALFKADRHFLIQLLRFIGFVFLAGLNLATIYFSGSRGPVLGWMAGVYFMALLLALFWRKRWLGWSIISVALAGVCFLLVFNLPSGPLTALRTSPLVGRFGRLLDTESNTAKVRLYIWQGVVSLVSPHAPLVYPDGSKDVFNFLRPLVGYGPESMYVVYSPFYPPELGSVERRNASPDRSHNETWDTLVTTGLLGFIAYLAIFLSVFYYGLHWLGWVNTNLEKRLFILSALLGGILGGIFLVNWGGWAYLGVGMPFGVALGLLCYLGFIGIHHVGARSGEALEPWRVTLMAALLAGVMAHFLEINFGIAIASTRLLFWFFSGLLLVIGRMPAVSSQGDDRDLQLTTGVLESTIFATRRSKRRKQPTDTLQEKINHLDWLCIAGWNGLLVGILLVALGYCFIINPNRLATMSEILSSAMTRMPASDNVSSPWVLWMFVSTWVGGVAFLSLETAVDRPLLAKSKIFLVAAAVALGAAFPYFLIHAENLAILAGLRLASVDDLLSQMGRVTRLLNIFYIYQAILLIGLAYFLTGSTKSLAGTSHSLKKWLAVGLAVISCFGLIVWSNLLPIHADTAYKLADPFTRNGNWNLVAVLYERAINWVPQQDQYYLFQGRTYMELGQQAQTTAEQSSQALRANEYLLEAQRLNPLNTDHTANLARLQAWWASVAIDPKERSEHAQAASDYYQRALDLSPNNAGLWGEWSSLYLEQLDRPDLAWQRLEKALSLDSNYNVTQALAGNFFLSQAKQNPDAFLKQQALEKALIYYRAAVDLSKGDQKARYLVKVSNLYIDLAEITQSSGGSLKYDRVRLKLALDPLFEALQVEPAMADQVSILGQLARIYREMNDKSNALVYIQSALVLAAENQRAYLEQLQVEINSMP